MADEATRVVRNEESSRYEVWVGDTVAGYSEYREQGGRTVFKHTEVDDAYEGQGLGTTLAAGALDDAMGRGQTLVPVCPFIANYVRKHNQYTPYVRWPGDGAGSGDDGA
ncbi:GNAT family N-acetyltransferase [Prauserella oleivorans]|uniref:GNAT family N-acetyltransferase n=1 Tax=Prauserella oleivorans TaxID=1478153 RepID=A0ABW5WDL8_9PSEU